MRSRGRVVFDWMALVVTPTIAATDAEAQADYEAAQAFRSSHMAVGYNLPNMSYTSGGRIDFGANHPDTLVGDIDLSRQNGEFTSIGDLFDGHEAAHRVPPLRFARLSA